MDLKTYLSLLTLSYSVMSSQHREGSQLHDLQTRAEGIHVNQDSDAPAEDNQAFPVMMRRVNLPKMDQRLSHKLWAHDSTGQMQGLRGVVNPYDVTKCACEHRGGLRGRQQIPNMGTRTYGTPAREVRV